MLQKLAVLGGVVSSAVGLLPGVSSQYFKKGDIIPVKTSTLSSTSTMMSYDYFDLPFCPPFDSTRDPLDVASILQGAVQKTAPYDVRVLENVTCAPVCSKSMTHEDVAKLTKFIGKDYRATWTVDGLPLVYTNDQERMRSSFPLGRRVRAAEGEKTDSALVYNHIHFVLKYKEAESQVEKLAEQWGVSSTIQGTALQQGTGYRVVGAAIRLESRHNNDCSTRSSQALNAAADQEVTPLVLNPAYLQKGEPSDTEQVDFTYSVSWEPSELEWGSRWDIYVQMGTSLGGPEEHSVHWMGMFISAMVTLTVVVTCLRLVLRATVGSSRTDVANMVSSVFEGGEGEDLDEDSIESWAAEVGWKTLAGDVFRKPNMYAYLCVFIGNGIQLLVVSVCTAALGALGVASPAHRNMIFYLVLLMFCATGVLSGFVGGLFCRLFNVDFSIRAPKFALYNALGYPLICFITFLVIDLLLWSQKSSSAVPLSTILSLVLPWLLFSSPCVCFGAFVALYSKPSGTASESRSIRTGGEIIFNNDVFGTKVAVKAIPKEVPKQPKRARLLTACLLGGYSIWLVISLEVSYIVRSVWSREFYSLFGFLLTVLGLFIVTSATVGIVSTYVAVASENWRWWWRAFFAPAACGLFLFGQLMSNLWLLINDVHFVAATIYALYCFLLCSAVACMAGAIGVIASFFFLIRIYSTSKSD